MKHDQLVSAVTNLARMTNANVGETQWYLFGSAQESFPNVSDIDLLVICQTHGTADAVRRYVDIDELTRPIHLSILTEAEEAEIRFVERQGCIRVI